MPSKRPMGASAPSGNAGFDVKVTRNEFVILGLLLPYLAMMLGMVIMLLFALVVRVWMHVDVRWLKGDMQDDLNVLTVIALFSAWVLCFCAYRFYGQRKAELVKEHALLTVFAGHYWYVMALWDSPAKWVFSQRVIFGWLFGCIIIGLSWCIRRWAKSDGNDISPDRENILAEIGLRDSYLQQPQIDGEIVTTRMQLAPGVTPEDVKNKRTQLAGLAGLPRTRLHVRDLENGREDQVDVVTLRRDPFKQKTPWQGPYLPGANIAEAIEYATYEDLSRPQLYLAGRKGGSSQHFLVMGMSGTGKSKCWQVIYGSVLNRREVSVVYGDPVKGIQTGGPLAEGLAWFADTADACVAQLNGVENAIRERTNYLAQNGLDHWGPGCGLNFLIVHMEEASRFSKMARLVELVEAARSAGIMLVFSLQRAVNTRMKTDVRFNLGGAMCFGTFGVRDAEFGLSEYSRAGGAVPHRWQDRYPSRHYLEAAGLDPRMFAMALESDWINTETLRAVIRDGAQYRTPMDDVTARALGPAYAEYVRAVERGETSWQRTYGARDGVDMFKHGDDDTPTLELGEPTGSGVASPVKLSKAEAETILWEWLGERASDGVDELSFGEIVEAINTRVCRSNTWTNQTLALWVTQGRLRKHARHGMWHTPIVTKI